MKKIFRLLPFALLGFALAACNDDDDANLPERPELRVLTFEDEDYKGTDNGGLGYNDWSSMIDKVQYGGELLYPATTEWLYNWYDEGNTFLASTLTDNYGNGSYAGGGHAVSNYTDTDLSHGDYQHQLAVYGNGGHSGKNFCVHDGCSDAVESQPSFYFKDNEERIVDHMWVNNTTYTLNIMQHGDAFGSTPFGADDYLKIVATGISAAGTTTGTCEFYLAKGTDFVTAWSEWDLSSLGKVARIAFNVEGSQTSEWGLNTPAYFAYDDVAVEF
ncbi:MAG: DUF4465 domain-containing protein [Alistipes sp.]|nr:DUF4465 domain-containing protein [Alistipes senegalensis]MCM1249827.1 DUF4465 domain-containing protein [Alistipes sp.]